MGCVQNRKVVVQEQDAMVPAPSTLPPARFGGGEVAYTSSAIQAEANAFASALADSNLLSHHCILNSYHHLPHLDKPTFKPLNAPSPW